MIWKISPLLESEILGVFVNTLTADYKFPVPDCENFLFPIQMQLSGKRKSFGQLFLLFMGSTSNFKHVQKNEDRHGWCISEITECQRLC